MAKIDVVCPACKGSRKVEASTHRFNQKLPGHTGMCKPCFMKQRKGKNHPRWKGGSFNSEGYRLVMAPNHPHAHKSGYMFEHRLVMEQHLGRLLDQSETVHHKDGNRQNNLIFNLELRTGNHGPGATLTLLPSFIVAEDIEWLEMW